MFGSREKPLLVKKTSQDTLHVLKGKRSDAVQAHGALHTQTRTASSLLPAGPSCPLSCATAPGVTLVGTGQNL